MNLIPKISKLKGGTPPIPYALLDELKIVAEISANKPFRFGDIQKPGQGLSSSVSWSMATPYARIDAQLIGDWCVEEDYPYRVNYKASTLGASLTYPKGIVPAGKSTVTWIAKPVGVIHGTKTTYWMIDGAKKLSTGYVYTYKECTQCGSPILQVDAGLQYKAPHPYADDYTHSASDRMFYSFDPPPVRRPLDTTIPLKKLGYVPSWDPDDWILGNCKDNCN
jgi:hypothetical protein